MQGGLVTYKLRALFAALLLLPAASAAGPVDGLGGFARRECKAFAEVFYRVAALRDNGAGKLLAVDEGVTFLTRLGQTGSHMKPNYRPAVTRFVDYVWARRGLEPRILFVHGLYHCALSRTTATDAALNEGLARLDALTTSCKARHRGRGQLKPLGQCIEDGMAAPAATRTGEAAPAER